MTAQSIDRRDTVVAFDDDLAAGVPLVTLASGERILKAEVFIEAAITASGYLFLFGEYGEVSHFTFEYLTEPEIGVTLFIDSGLAVQNDSLVAKSNAGTSWTAGSLRFSFFVAA